MDTRKITIRRGILFHFKHQHDIGRLDAAHPLVGLAKEAMSQRHNGTPFIQIEVTAEEEELIREYREQGIAATEDYLRRHPKVNWVPRGGWNFGLSDTISEEVLHRTAASQGRLAPTGFLRK